MNDSDYTSPVMEDAGGGASPTSIFTQNVAVVNNTVGVTITGIAVVNVLAMTVGATFVEVVNILSEDDEG